MAKIRLIASDMDGTLLGTDRSIDQATKQAIQRVRDAGIIFCLASGRSYCTMTSFGKELGLEGPMVCCNGAVVFGPDGTSVETSLLSATAVDLILKHAQAASVHTNAYTDRDVYFSAENQHAALYRERTGLANVEILDWPSMRELQLTKLLYVDHPENIERLEGEMKVVLADHGVTVVRSEPDYVEFLPTGITKGMGLSALCASLHIGRESVAAIGDWLNDKEMLEWVGWPAAVANAHPEILALARHVYPKNSEGGVAAFLDSVLESHKLDILPN